MNLISLQIGRSKTISTEDPGDKPWTSGIFKSPVDSPVVASVKGLVGDQQADLRVHGGPDKAICAYPSESFAYWKAELGLDLAPGAFGENATTSGMFESTLCIGDVFRVGGATVQISQPRQPCWKLARRWGVKDLPLRVQTSGFTGWYFRVLEEGALEAGDSFELQSRPAPDWPLHRANELMHDDAPDRRACAELAELPQLSESWRIASARKAEKQAAADSSKRLGPPNS